MLIMNDFPTFFEETAEGLAWQLREAAVDHEAFEQALPVCDLARCRATCCHDGAILSGEEASKLSALDDRDGIIRLEDGRWKTRTVGAEREELADDFPAHFPRTRCVYLDDAHRCSWQLRAVEEGKHPWFYKPTSCWMHPVLLTRRERRPVLTILSDAEDSQKFASLTSCGRASACAQPARLSLGMELKMLSQLSGRDFGGELNAPSIS